jgi:class 3 adenylate cyclase/Flp pilus assembly protein TadD
MPDLSRMERTWLCTVVFTDIVQYSSQSVELQMKWKARFNTYVAAAIRDVPEDERVILDTGDGAAICFLGAPEAAMFAALEMWQSFIRDEKEQQPGLRVRIGINLGPIKLVKDINGSLNAIGDGMNAGQRVMSFAGENQILVSQSFFEVVSRVSDDYKALFKLKGVETDKHVREHTVYSLFPPGTDRGPATIQMPAYVPKAAAAASVPQTAAEKPAATSTQPSISTGTIAVITGTAALAGVIAAGAFHFLGHGKEPAAPAPPIAAVAEPSVPVTATTPAAKSAPVTERPAESSTNSSPNSPTRKESAPPKSSAAPSSPATKEAPTPAPPAEVDPAPTQVPAAARAAFDAGETQLDHDQAAASIAHFDEAIRISPNYIEAYVGRAEARRLLGQYEVSLDDCNKVMQLKPTDPRAYNCRGHGYLLMKQYEKAIPDLDQAIRLNPTFVLAFENRGNSYAGLQQWEKAIPDYSQAIRFRSKNGEFYFRRAVAYAGLKQYQKSVDDYTEAIRLQPHLPRGYLGRAAVEELMGNGSAAIEDRRHARENRKKK